MLIPFPKLIDKFNIRPVGVMHLGASTGQEAESYYACGVKKTVWVEAIPEIYEDLVKHISQFPEALAIQSCVHEADDEIVPFNISSNNGESSSLYEFDLHSHYHPDVKFIGQIHLRSQRMDTMINRYEIKMEDFDFLNIDLQGAELMALKGMGKYLSGFKYAYIEVNKAFLYKDVPGKIHFPLIEEIEAYLKEFGFTRKEILMTDNQWGDAFYMRNL